MLITMFLVAVLVSMAATALVAVIVLAWAVASSLTHPRVHGGGQGGGGTADPS